MISEKEKIKLRTRVIIMVVLVIIINAAIIWGYYSYLDIQTTGHASRDINLMQGKIIEEAENENNIFVSSTILFVLSFLVVVFSISLLKKRAEKETETFEMRKLGREIKPLKTSQEMWGKVPKLFGEPGWWK